LTKNQRIYEGGVTGPVHQFINTYIKFFFLLTPFFLLSTFLALTQDKDEATRRKLAVKVIFATIVICMVIFLIGNYIFQIFGITLDSFRIGTGILLILSAISLVRGRDRFYAGEPSEDISVVPLAIPVTVGPATTGALLVMGGELQGIWERMIGLAGILAAVLSVGLLIYLSGSVERLLKKQGLTILSKITGLILAALAAQLVMVGILGFLGRPGTL
jgi:multiple antibiotic resistance protein